MRSALYGATSLTRTPDPVLRIEGRVIFADSAKVIADRATAGLETWPAFGFHSVRVRIDDVVADHLNAKTPRIERIRFLTTEDSGHIVVGRIEPMLVDGPGASLQPDPGRAIGFRNGLAEHLRGIHPGLHDLPTVPGAVSAVNTAPGQIDHDVAVFQLLSPAPK
jgi:hypothetical protein